MIEQRLGAGTGSVQVLARGVSVLDCFTPERPWLALAEIRRATGLPATTVTRLVHSLVELDLLQRRGDEYTVGLRVLGWTASATAGSDLMEAVGPVLVHLRDMTGETSGLYIRRGTTRVSVAVELSRQSVIYRGQIGQVMPLHSGAAGKVFMAFDASALDAIIAQEDESAPGGALANRAGLNEQLAMVRRKGWAYSQGEREQGLNSISAPVFNSSGHIIAALAVGGPSFRLTPDLVEQFSASLLEGATSLSRRMGWKGGTSATTAEGADWAVGTTG